MPRDLKHFYDFGTYRVDESERRLLRGDEVVPLTPKAFEMLLVLVESSGHVLTKEDLMKRVWPDTIVEEANLSHNIYKLREALDEGRNGEKYIETVPRRGYRFVAKVTEVRDAEVEMLVAERTRADGARGLASLPDGRIAYVARTGDEYDIWTARNDGAEARALTADSYSQGDLSTTPDGRYLIFASDRAGVSHLFRMNIDGSGLKQLTFGDASDSAPDCSPDSKSIVYSSTDRGNTTIWKVPVEGGTPLQLTSYESVAPSFSPDGQMLSCILPAESKMKQASIAVISKAGGAPLRTFEVMTFAFYYHSATWTPDGQGLVFPRTENNVINLWRQPINGGLPRVLTNFNSDSIYNYAYTRDGKSIIIARGKVVVNVALITNFR